MIQPGQETNDLNLVVVARIADSPKEFVREIFKERYRAGWEFSDMPERVDEWEKEEPEADSPKRPSAWSGKTGTVGAK